MSTVSGRKACTKCGRRLPLDHFYRDRRRRDGRHTRCKDCHNEAVRVSRRKHQERNANRTIDPRQPKRCGSCGETKVAADFSRNRNARDGLHWVCKDCNTSGFSPDRRPHYERHGLSDEDFDAIFATQDGRCAICREEFADTTPHVDHDHRTGAVRGLLCFACNTGLGLLRDDPDSLGAAARYLCERVPPR